MDETKKILEAKQVYKIYRGRPVIRNATLELYAGECVLITGDNSSGKTTLLRLLSGITMPTTGTIRRREKLSMQYVPARAVGDFRVTALDFLIRMAMVDGYSRREAKAVCAGMFAHYRLSGLEKVAINKLSDGVFQKLMIAQAMLLPCELLLLDEPFMGLDPDTRKLVFSDMIKMKQQNTAILMVCPCESGIEDREALVDKVWHIEHGEIKESGR